MTALRAETASAVAPFGIDRIRQLLPHRWPMLLVDRVVAVGPGPRITGLKTVSGAEPWFSGHFPEHAVLPGVIAVEALAQVSGLLASVEAEAAGDDTGDDASADVVLFTAIRSARFSRQIVPGDVVVLTSERVAGSAGFAEYRATATVDGHLAVKAQLTLAAAAPTPTAPTSILPV